MELLKEILVSILQKNEVNIVFSGLDISNEIETKSYQILQKIKTVIENDSLSDFECIEEIVCIFEEAGVGCGGRHDF